MDFSAYNGSGKALDHLIARYGIEAEWPPCTNWSKTVEYPGPVSWADEAGSIQRGGTAQVVAPGETVTKTLYIIAYHTDEPRFARWSVDYNFAEGTHAAPAQQPAPATPRAALPPSPTQPDAPPLSQATGLPSVIGAGDTCAGKAEGSACWLALDDPPGCYLWIANLGENMTATWSGECANGLAEGTGEIFSIWGSSREFNATDTGQLQQGKRHGQWSDLKPLNKFYLSLSEDGGLVVKDRMINRLEKGPYVDGKRHGRWVSEANGDVREGPYVDGKEHGRWVYHDDDGDMLEGPFVDGKQHGRWVKRNPDGELDREYNWVNGEIQSQRTWDGGQWVTME